MPHTGFKFRYYTLTADSIYEARVYSCFGCIISLDGETENIIKTPIKHFEKAQILFSLLGMKDESKELEHQLTKCRSVWLPSKHYEMCCGLRMHLCRDTAGSKHSDSSRRIATSSHRVHGPGHSCTWYMAFLFCVVLDLPSRTAQSKMWILYPVNGTN